MANRTLNWWIPCNHERKLLIGPEHALHWIHWHTSCSCVGKYGWKTVESSCNLVWFFGSVLWRELASLIEILAQGQMPRGFSSLQLCCKFQGRVLIKQSFYLPFLNFPGWLVVQLLLLFSSHRHVCRTWMVLWKFTVPCLAAWSLWKWILLWKLVQI